MMALADPNANFSDYKEKTIEEKINLLLLGRKVYNHFCIDTNILIHDLDFVSYLVNLPRSWVYIPYFVMQELGEILQALF